MGYVTYRDPQGMLRGAYLPDGINPRGWTAEQIEALMITPLNPPDVRRLDMEAVRVALHEAMINAQIDITKIDHSRTNLLSLCGGVLLRHLDQIIRS